MILSSGEGGIEARTVSQHRPQDVDPPPRQGDQRLVVPLALRPLDAELLFESKERYGVDLFGPTRPDRKWQAKEGTGFEAAAFSLDWENRIATCPEGKESISWSPAIDNRHNRVVKIKFSSKDCMPCPNREKCVRSTRRCKRRSITVRVDGHQQALRAARSREKEPGFAAAYARRAGVEGTVSRAVRAAACADPDTWA